MANTLKNYERKRRLIKSGTLNAAAAYVAFDADNNGNSFKLDEIETIICIPKTTGGSRNVVYSIETLTPAYNGAMWVATVSSATSTTQDAIIHSTIKRYPVAWRAAHEAYSVNVGGDYAGAISTNSAAVRFSMNGASWVRTNNPLYVTKFAFQLAVDDLPAGTYYEIYGTDYEG